MSQTRREFMVTASATAAITILPYSARAATGSSDVFETAGGEIKVHPVSHASFVMETPAGTIYSDPVGGASAYADHPAPDLILVTHRHGDHFDAETLTALVSDGTEIVTCADVHAMMPDGLKERQPLVPKAHELSPQLRRGRHHARVRILESVRTILGEQQRSIEIDPVGGLRDECCGRHGE